MEQHLFDAQDVANSPLPADSDEQDEVDTKESE
jgi:hypothetical protein